MQDGRITGSRGRASVRAALLVGVLAGGLALSACGPDDGGQEALGGFGVPTQPAGSPFPGERQDLRGTLHTEDDGCLTWDDGSGERRWIVWPHGVELDPGSVGVRLPERAAPGDELVGTGAHVRADQLPGWENEDSYLRAFGGFCDAARRGVVVLDEVRLG